MESTCVLISAAFHEPPKELVGSPPTSGHSSGTLSTNHFPWEVAPRSLSSAALRSVPAHPQLTGRTLGEKICLSRRGTVPSFETLE